jgi:hypothetical protein
MRGRAVVVVSLALVCGSGPANARASDINPLDRAALETVIRSHVGSGRSADGQPVEEYADGRHVLVGRGLSVGSSYVAAVYTIETGNTWQIYLAVVDGTSHRVLADGRVGGKGYRTTRVKAVKDGVIEVEAKYYGPGDAMCCPTVPGTSWFGVRDGLIWEAEAKIETSRSPEK